MKAKKDGAGSPVSGTYCAIPQQIVKGTVKTDSTVPLGAIER
jgi:hypothetical protein